MNLTRLESEKKFADLVDSLQKKQEQIDELLREKRQMEAEIEFVWQSTTAENRRVKESFLDLKAELATTNHQHNGLSASSFNRLLIQDSWIVWMKLYS